MSIIFDLIDINQSELNPQVFSDSESFTLFSQDCSDNISIMTNELTSTDDLNRIQEKNKEISEKMNHRVTAFSYMMYQAEENAKNNNKINTYCGKYIDGIIVNEFVDEIFHLTNEYSNLCKKRANKNRILEEIENEKNAITEQLNQALVKNSENHTKINEKKAEKCGIF